MNFYIYKTHNKKMYNVYKNQLKRYLINPDECFIDFDKMNIFTSPVIELFFWKDETNDVFYALYMYQGKYFCIYDAFGICNVLNQDNDDKKLLEYLFNKIMVYDSLFDIDIELYHNSILNEQFVYFKKVYCSNSNLSWSKNY